jgi:hypothetical protein
MLGRNVSGAGDVNGDGFGDVIEGDYLDQVHVWSGFDGSLLHTFTVAYSSGVAGAGDLNGDGYADVWIAAPNANPAHVEARSGLDGTLLYEAVDHNDGGFARSLGVIGDLNGDGAAEFIVGSESKKFVVCDGATGTATFEHQVLSAEDYGRGVCGVGDVDLDGSPDYVVGAPGSPYFPGDPGFIEIFSGASNTVLHHVANPVGGISFGGSVRWCGDIDGDGHADVLTARPGFNGAGSQLGIVVVISGANGAVIRRWTDADMNSAYPYGLAGTGDLDSDGVPDIAAAATIANRVYLYSGADGSTIATLSGNSTFNNFGGGLAAADLDLDGVPELIVGDMLDDGAGWNAGAIFIYAMGCATPFEYCTAKTNSQGCTPTITSSGFASLSSSESFGVRIEHVLNNQPGALIWSREADATPFSGGLLCVASPYRVQIGHSGGNPPPADCSGVYTFSLEPGWFLAQGFRPGDEIYFQVISRDPFFAPGQELGLTSALRTIVCP